MPLQKLQFRPGVNREGTDYSNEGGWYACDKVRFRSGFPEKIGGWVRLSNNTFVGVCRALWNWATLAGSNLLGVGTSKKYYIESGGNYNDVTPLVLNSAGNTTTTLTSNPFSATSGSNLITVTDTVSGIITNVGDYITLTSTTTVGGLTIQGEYTVTAVITSQSFRITASASASSTGTGGGTVTIQYQYPVGNDVFTVNNGWGAGPWSPTTPTALGANPFSMSAGSNVVTVTQNAHGYLTTAGSFVVGQQYKIVSTGSGSTNFTLIGAASNAIGTVFTATGVGTGSGTASNVWVAFLGATAVNSTAVTFGFSGTVAFPTTPLGIGFYGHPLDTFAASLFNSTFELTYVDANTYTITIQKTATYGMLGGGSNVVAYPQYGIRPWNSAADVGIGQQLRLWSNDNFGEDLIIAPRGGAIFYWDATAGITVRAVELSTLASGATVPGTAYTYKDFVPNQTNQIIGSAIQRFVIAFGSNPYDPTNPNSTFDPLLVRWSDQENPFLWVPDATNQSGEYRLNIGSTIICAKSTRQEILVWSDAAIYSMQYLGPPYIWGFQLLQDNITVMSPNSAITINNITYWMGTDKFFMYSGRVETLPCAIWQFIFDDINKDQAFQVFAGSNEAYSEVWWFYCSQDSGVVDSYVIYNYLERTWAYGTMNRTAWLDSGLRQYPMAADGANNRILYHEANVDDVSGLTPVPIEAYIQSSDFDIGDGHNFGFVWRILPDLTFNGSNVNQPHVTMTVRPRRNSGAPYGTADNPQVASAQNYASRGTYDVQEFDGQVYTRLRARQMSFRIESTTLGVAWQLGTPRIDIRPDGRR
jgi:hypothetical protein